MADVAAALLKVKTHDADVARLQARHAALADAIKLNQRASRVDDDGEPIA